MLIIMMYTCVYVLVHVVQNVIASVLLIIIQHLDFGIYFYLSFLALDVSSTINRAMCMYTCQHPMKNDGCHGYMHNYYSDICTINVIH